MRIRTLMLLSLLSLTMIQCSDDAGNGNTESKGTMKVKVTDAPIDDANITAAVVTFTALEVDGQRLDLANKMSLNLLAYQNGQTEDLLSAELEGKTYSKLSLILDNESDLMGESPGCYILTKDGVKHRLAAAGQATTKIDIPSSSFKVEENATTELVVDFDLRKCVRKSQSSGSNYQFATNLSTQLRVVKGESSSAIKGNISDPLLVSGDRIVVYAYKKGSYNAQTETSVSNSTDIMFQNAECSAVANSSGNFTLSFLEEGDYELHMVAYENNDADSEMEVKGFLQTNVLGSLNLLNIDLSASADVTINLTVVGIIPI